MLVSVMVNKTGTLPCLGLYAKKALIRKVKNRLILISKVLDCPQHILIPLRGFFRVSNWNIDRSDSL